MSKDPNKKHYFDKTTPDEQATLLMKIVKQNLTLYLWEEGQEEKDLEEFSPVNYDPSSRRLILDRKGGLISKLSKSKLSGKNALIKVIVENVHLFSFSSLEYKKETNNYQMVLDHDILKSQQRTNYRLEAGKLTIIKFRIDGDLFEANDVSAGGTSFTITKNHLERFSKGTTFTNGCALQIMDQRFDLPECTIAGSWPILDIEEKPTEWIRIGVAFGALPKALEESLTQKINTEARAQEFGKKFKKK